MRRAIFAVVVLITGVALAARTPSAAQSNAPAPAIALRVVAGTGAAGFSGDGGPADQARLALNGDRLELPAGIAVDSAGNLFFVDAANQRVRRVDAKTGFISTVAGNGVAGFSGDGGPATRASLHLFAASAARAVAAGGSGVAVDAAGDIYIGDTLNQRIRRVDALTGVITTLAAGDALSHPVGLALDARDNLFIADRGANAILRRDAATGLVSIVASVTDPAAITVDRGGEIIFVASPGTHTVARVEAVRGNWTVVAGRLASPGPYGGGGAATAAQLNSPAGVALDAAGNLFIADTLNHRVRRVDAKTGVISTVPGGGLSHPAGITLDGQGNVFVLDAGNRRAVELRGAAAASPASGSFSPPSLAFGLEPKAGSTSPMSTTLTNSGGTDLTISTVSILDANSMPSLDYSQTNGCGGTVMKNGGSCPFNITFKPQDVGARPARLSINGAPAGDPLSLGLSGTGDDYSFAPAMGSSDTMTKKAGETATFPLVITATNGFSGTVVLTCPFAPTAGTCTLDHTSVDISVNGTANVTATITTTKPGAAPPRIKFPALPSAAPILSVLTAIVLACLMAAWFWIGVRQNRGAAGARTTRWRRFVPAAAVVIALAALAGCYRAPGGAATTGTLVGTYHLVVIGTSQNASRSAPLTLIVN